MTRQLWRFPGGVSLDYHREASTAEPVLQAPVPPWLTVALQQHIGEAAEPLVNVGDRVLAGQPLARATGYVSAGVHAPSSGSVVALEQRPVPHPSGLTALCAVIETDGRDEWVPGPAPICDWRSAEPAALRRRVRECGLVGLGGAAFPTAVKLNPAAPSRTIERVIINGAECEPHITCDDMLMRGQPASVIAGAAIIRHAVGARECLIGVEDNKPEAIDALETALDGDEAGGIEVVPVPTRYPAGGEKQLIYTLTGREVPSGGIPQDIGMVCHNVGTAAAVADAVLRGRALVERIVTVAGDGVRHPRNVRARIGTPLRFLVDLCGGYTEDADRLIMGGPMMGFALGDDDVPVVKGTNCLLAATAETLPRPQPALPCIRCGACADACPASLLPQQLYWYARARDLERAREHNLFDCIECGACAYVCPSHIPLVDYYRFAKSEIWEEERERRKADLARERYEFRQQRLEREQREREERRQRKRAALRARDSAQTDKKAAIDAALARARRKQKNAPSDEQGSEGNEH